jgi:hypothetical protein
MTSADTSVPLHDPATRAEWLTAAGLWVSGLILAGLALHWVHRGALTSGSLAPSDDSTQTTDTSATPAGQACSAMSGGVFMPEDSIVAHREP